MARLSPTDQVLMGSRCGGQSGMLGVRILPATRDTTISNWALNHYVRTMFRLQSPFMRAAAEAGLQLKCQCGAPIDEFLLHPHSCMNSRPGRQIPHDALVWRLVSLFETLPGVYKIEREVVMPETAPKRTDIAFRLADGTRIYVDPTLISSICKSNFEAALRKPLAAEGVLEKGKARKMQEYPADLQNLIPLVVTILTTRIAPTAGAAMDALWMQSVKAMGTLGDFASLNGEALRRLTSKSTHWRNAWRKVATVCVVTAVAKNTLARVARRLELKGYGANSEFSALLWGTTCAPGQDRDSPDSLDTKRWTESPYLEIPRVEGEYSGGATRCGLPHDV
jgi:hypothetical protein